MAMNCHTLVCDQVKSNEFTYFFSTITSVCRFDAILPRKGPVTRALSKRLQEDWARAAEEGPRILMNLRVDL